MRLVTEEEAAELWCPMSFSNDDPVRCCGARCMAWRWGRRRYMVVFDGRPEEEYRWDPRAHATSKDDPRYVTREVSLGYCGLAGRPT